MSFFVYLFFEYTLPGKSFELRLKYIKKCQYNCWYSKLFPGKNTQKVNKQKFVFRKIGCSHEVNAILLTEIRWYFDTGNVEIPLFLFLRMNTTLSNIWNKPLQNIKFQFDNGTKSVFLSIMWTETEAKEPAIISKKFHSGEQDWTIGLIREINFLQKINFTAVFFLKLVQCQSWLNREIQPFGVEVVRFTHT